MYFCLAPAHDTCSYLSLRSVLKMPQWSAHDHRSISLLQMSLHERWNLPPLYFTNLKITRMWANAQRDGGPAQHRWRPLFNAAEFGWRPLLDCRAVTLPRHDICWNVMGCPKPANRSQPLMGRSSPYCGRHVKEALLVNKFFPDCRHVP